MEKRNSQREPTNKRLRTCDLGVARYQSQHQFHFWQMSSMFEFDVRSVVYGQVSLAAVNQILCQS